MEYYKNLSSGLSSSSFAFLFVNRPTGIVGCYSKLNNFFTFYFSAVCISRSGGWGVNRVKLAVSRSWGREGKKQLWELSLEEPNFSQILSPLSIFPSFTLTSHSSTHSRELDKLREVFKTKYGQNSVKL